MILNVIFIIMGCILLSLCLRFLYISLRFSKRHTAKAKGFLCNCDYQKNVYRGGKAGRVYRHWVEYSYKYTIGSKEYQIGCANPGKPNEIRKVVEVIYQVKHPQFAYIKNLTIPMQPFISAALLIPGVIFLICGIFI